MTVPKQKPRRSVQEVGTPPDFLEAVKERFGPLSWDLAADESNHVTMGWFGPGSSMGEDSLVKPWRTLAGLCWLNPPFGDIGKWAAKAVEESTGFARILMLVPASVGSNWFNESVRPNAYVLELTPRIKFVGHAAGYPKDLVLCVFSKERLTGRRMWKWKP